MDDQKQPFNQLNNQPKDDQDVDISSSAPVEMEPATKSSPSMGPMSQPSQSPSATPQPPTMPEQPEASMAPMQDADHLLEAPHKKSGLLIATVVVVLVIALALMGTVVYQALY